MDIQSLKRKGRHSDKPVASAITKGNLCHDQQRLHNDDPSASHRGETGWANAPANPTKMADARGGEQARLSRCNCWQGSRIYWDPTVAMSAWHFPVLSCCVKYKHSDRFLLLRLLTSWPDLATAWLTWIWTLPLVTLVVCQRSHLTRPWPLCKISVCVLGCWAVHFKISVNF